ncbi:MAG TPA: cation:proton antiporter subunit C [Candidatus Baltobacteraceae bacterium]|nr:cation:proton antiporter subunit C [Candidatus Baltobacteraceae bacterium]
MSGALLYLPYAVAVWLFLAGAYGLVRSRHLVHSVLCLAVVQSSTYVLLLSIGFLAKAGAPIFNPPQVPSGSRSVDPVVQALTLTDIVVGATVTALLLAMTIQIHRRKGTVDPHALRLTRG